MRTPRPLVLPTQPASLSMLLATGATAQMVRTRVASGALRRVRHGVYLAASAWPDTPREQHLVSAHAELVAHPDAVMSHESAAVWWNLPSPTATDWHDAAPAVTLPSTTGAKSRPGPATHHIGALPAGQVGRDDEGYPVTSPARTGVDLAVGLTLPEALVVLDGAARRVIESMIVNPRRRDYLNPRLAAAAVELLSAAAETRRPGGLSRAIPLVVPARESVPESLAAGHLVLAGLPTPEFQHVIRTTVGDLYPDFYWSDQRLIGEVDGKVKYADPDAYEREKVREQVLRDLGYRIVRWTAREIMFTPHVVLERIARAMGL